MIPKGLYIGFTTNSEHSNVDHIMFLRFAWVKIQYNFFNVMFSKRDIRYGALEFSSSEIELRKMT